MRKKAILTTVVTGILASMALPALAQEAILRVPYRRARGIESKVVEVKVYPYKTGATVINFRPTQEKIRQVTLGGASLSLSSDAPGCLSSESKGSSEACSATVLYLQQKIPETIHPAQKTQATRMTVLTDKNMYFFQIELLSSGYPVYSMVEIQPELRQYAPLISLDQITTLIKGFKVAAEKEYLNNPELNRRVRNFLEMVRTEQSLESAAAKAGISMKVVNKLYELGSRHLLPVPQSQSPSTAL